MYRRLVSFTRNRCSMCNTTHGRPGWYRYSQRMDPEVDTATYDVWRTCSHTEPDIQQYATTLSGGQVYRRIARYSRILRYSTACGSRGWCTASHVFAN
jgi:hypothetical protein